MAQTTPNGSVYAFVISVGLIRASDPNVGWSNLSIDFGDAYFPHLAADPPNADKLYAVTNRVTFERVRMVVKLGKR